MKILITVDMRNCLDATAKMALEGQLPEFAAKTLAVSLRDKAESNARKVIGNGGFGQELAAGVRVRTNGSEVIVDHVTNDTNHLAEHVHDGGPIRHPQGKYLAIPIDQSVKGEMAREHRWQTPDGKPLFLRKKGDGLHGRAYLAEPRGKRGKLKALYVLVKETKPQCPRPWWPSDQEFIELTERELAWWLKKTLPERI